MSTAAAGARARERERARATSTSTSTHTHTHTSITITISGLGPYDILCGRGKRSYNNIGNRRFRVMISLNLPKYLKCESRAESNKMISKLIKELQDMSIRFFKRTKGSNSDDGDDDVLVEQIDEKQIHVKVSHALRDNAFQHRSNKIKQMSTASTTNKSCQVATTSMSMPIAERVVSISGSASGSTSTSTSASASNYYQNNALCNTSYDDHRRRLCELMKEAAAVAAEIEEFEQSQKPSLKHRLSDTFNGKVSRHHDGLVVNNNENNASHHHYQQQQHQHQCRQHPFLSEESWVTLASNNSSSFHDNFEFNHSCSSSFEPIPLDRIAYI